MNLVIFSPRSENHISHSAYDDISLQPQFAKIYSLHFYTRYLYSKLVLEKTETGSAMDSHSNPHYFRIRVKTLRWNRNQIHMKRMEILNTGKPIIPPSK